MGSEDKILPSPKLGLGDGSFNLHIYLQVISKNTIPFTLRLQVADGKRLPELLVAERTGRVSRGHVQRYGEDGFR
jgi:hypothetical protein